MSKASGCTGKKFFWSKDTADNACRRRKKVYGVSHHSYECPYCAMWHLTTKAKKGEAINPKLRDFIPARLKSILPKHPSCWPF